LKKQTGLTWLKNQRLALVNRVIKNLSFIRGWIFVH